MRVFFVNPPLRDWRFSRSQRSPGVIKSGTMYYPYWLAHAAALAESKGHEIVLMDCPADNLGRPQLLAALKEFQAEMVVFDTSTPSFNHDLETVTVLSKEHPCHYVASGTHATAEWQVALKQCPELDFVAIGEFDLTIVELAKALEEGKDPARVPGVGLMRDGEPVRGPARLPIEDMDTLPWIAPIYKRFLTPHNYLFTNAHQPMLMLIGGRGCKSRCFFCVYPQVMHGHTYRTRSPEHLVGEMKWIEDNMPEVKEIVFEDDTFTSDRAWAQRTAALIKEKGVTIPWFANIRTNVDYETLKALRQAGLRECATGFESADKTVLANMRKGQVPSQQHAFMENARALGILVHGCFMVGFPGETQETMEKTFQLAVELEPDSAQFYPVMPYPGTGAYQWAKDNGYLATENFDEWLTDEGGHRCVLNLPGLQPEDMEQFCEQAFRRFYLRPEYIMRKLIQAIRDPREGLRSVNGFINFLKYLFSDGQKRGQGKLMSKPIHVDDAWHTRIQVPKGRMERVADMLRTSSKRTDDDDAL
ncbi:MAG: radical SAM protein, partial [Myxococcota bacterium]